MSKLPTVEHLYYNVTIPGTNKAFKYRPMVVKEHRLLLEALQFENPDMLVNTIKSIGESCTNNIVDIDKLSMSEMDFLFLQVRAKSAGEIMSVQYKCNNIVKAVTIGDDGTKIETDNDVACGRVVNVNINLLDATIAYPEGYAPSKVIQVTDRSGIKLREPSFEAFRKSLKTEPNQTAITDQFIFSCIENIYDKDKVLIPEKDFSFEDFKVYLDDLDPVVLEEIDDFYNNMPNLELRVKFKCPSCGHEELIIIEGLDNFFD